MRGGDVAIKCRRLACLEDTLASGSGAIDEIPNGVIQGEWLGAKSFHQLRLVVAQVLKSCV